MAEPDVPAILGALNPGGIPLSRKKLKRLHPEFFGLTCLLASLYTRTRLWRMPAAIANHLQWGDGRAAVVVSTRPLRVSAYSDDLDCVALLRFPHRLVKEYDLEVGTRLLTTNTYSDGAAPDEDLTFGPGNTEDWNGFWPVIADFLSEDLAALEDRKATIDSREWKRTMELGRRWFEKAPDYVRDGRPWVSDVPAGSDPLELDDLE